MFNTLGEIYFVLVLASTNHNARNWYPKMQWLVTSQTYCACSCCNSTAQARHYGQLLVLRRHGLVTGYLGGVPFHLRSLVNPPTTTKERKKHCAYENSSVCVRLALSKIYWSCWILQSCPILPHCYDRYGLLRAVDRTLCLLTVGILSTYEAWISLLHQVTVCYGSCGTYGVLDWYGS